MGSRTFRDYDLNRLIPYIDWKPFFDVWQLRGKYPNRGYPRIFDDADVGAEAKKVFQDAQNMLKRVIDEKAITAHAVVGFFPAASEGDDIHVFHPDDTEHRGQPIATFLGLRQQADREHDQPCFCMSDFLPPRSLNKPDYIGVFACTAGLGADELSNKFVNEQLDDYSGIMIKALADRLAEVCSLAFTLSAAQRQLASFDLTSVHTLGLYNFVAYAQMMAF